MLNIVLIYWTVEISFHFDKLMKFCLRVVVWLFGMFVFFLLLSYIDIYRLPQRQNSDGQTDRGKNGFDLVLTRFYFRFLLPPPHSLSLSLSIYHSLTHSLHVSHFSNNCSTEYSNIIYLSIYLYHSIKSNRYEHKSLYLLIARLMTNV